MIIMHPLIKLQLQIQKNNEIQKRIKMCTSQIVQLVKMKHKKLLLKEFPLSSISLKEWLFLSHQIVHPLVWLELLPKSILSHDG